MNLPSIIVALVIAVLAVLAMRYSLKNGRTQLRHSRKDKITSRPQRINRCGFVHVCPGLAG